MALQAERSDIRKIAFAPALHHRHDMIRVPECSSGIGLDAPLGPGPCPRGAAQFLQVMKGSAAVGAAGAAHAPVTLEQSLAKVTGIAAQLPFFDAPFGAECEPAFRDLEVAPAAKITAVCALRQPGPIGPAAAHGALCAHPWNILAT